MAKTKNIKGLGDVEFPAPKTLMSVGQTLSAFEILEKTLAAGGMGVLEKFDLSERLGGSDNAMSHLKNLRQATHVVEGGMEDLVEETARKHQVKTLDLSTNIFCCRKNIIEPAEYAGYFQSDLEHVRDALNVLRAWKALTSAKTP